jgi:phage-related protein
MSHSISFFNERVEADILAWPPGIRASLLRILERMGEHGANLGMPYTKAIGSGLFEIRAKGSEGIGRAFFCVQIGKRIVILHGFIKKTQETPPAELKIARKRLKEVQHGQS